MQLISCHNGRLLASALAEETLSRPKVFTTGLAAIDDLLPHGGFARGAVHEILAQPHHGTPRFFALLLARCAAASTPGQSGVRAAPPRIPDASTSANGTRS